MKKDSTRTRVNYEFSSYVSCVVLCCVGSSNRTLPAGVCGVVNNNNRNKKIENNGCMFGKT